MTPRKIMLALAEEFNGQAKHYAGLAEKTFPVSELDARQLSQVAVTMVAINVAITKAIQKLDKQDGN